MALCGLIVSSQILIINSKKKSTGVKISLAVICMVVLVVVGFLAPADGEEGFMKKNIIIMTDDVNHEIAYIVFVDPDLDVVTEMDYFIGSYCGWDHIS